MLDFIGMVITATLMVLFVNVLTTFMDVTRVAKVALAAVIGVWIGLAAAVAGAGWLPTVHAIIAVQLRRAKRGQVAGGVGCKSQLEQCVIVEMDVQRDVTTETGVQALSIEGDMP